MSNATAGPVTLDAFGLTDKGLVRSNNEDHFVVAEVRKSVTVSHGSLSAEALIHRQGVMGAHLLLVADGVGGGPDGDLASERSAAAVLSYVGSVAGCFHALDAAREHDLLAELESAVHGVHEQLVREAGGSRAQAPATTLTLILLVWPRAYLVHVGDSRAYVRRRGRTQRLTRDQNFGEMMVAAGAWTEEQAAKIRTAETLASAVGGSDLLPVVGLVDLEPGDSILLCSDGLTKHVSDEEIAQALSQGSSAESVTQGLVQRALQAGGTDNVTVIVARSFAA
jgi:protein phosphatase